MQHRECRSSRRRSDNASQWLEWLPKPSRGTFDHELTAKDRNNLPPLQGAEYSTVRPDCPLRWVMVNSGYGIFYERVLLME